jgi:hypothetical protein
MLIKYVGQYAPVELAARLDLGPIPHGGIVDVDDALGVLCCEQTLNWVPGDAEAQSILDAFYAWVAAHEKVQVDTTGHGDLEWRWVPRAVTPADDADSVPAPTTRARSRAAAETPQED